MKYNNNGHTPLHAACINGNIDIVNSLLKCNSSVNLLIKFAFVTECHNYCQVKSVQHLYDHLYKQNVNEYINVKQIHTTPIF
jgi:ankyrin repeat protein